MMTAEGVARRIMPDHDIWTAADPVVRRWMARELSPAARIRRFADEAAAALRNIARLAETLPTATVEVREAPPERSGLLWFAAGAVVAGAAFLAASYLR